jgi:transcriptional regulator NrdR family protein
MNKIKTNNNKKKLRTTFDIKIKLNQILSDQIEKQIKKIFKKIYNNQNIEDQI